MAWRLESHYVVIVVNIIIIITVIIIIIITLLSWLQFPSLCLQYYKLVTFLAEIHADKFGNLASTLFQNIVASLEHGLLSYP